MSCSSSAARDDGSLGGKILRITPDGDPAPVWDDVAEWEWVEVADLTAALAAVPATFSPWLVQQWRQGAFEDR